MKKRKKKKKIILGSKDKRYVKGNVIKGSKVNGPHEVVVTCYTHTPIFP